jgi:hypothetical protein
MVFIQKSFYQSANPRSDQANSLVLFMKGEKRGLFFVLEEYFQRQNRPSTEDAKDGRVR